MGEVVVARGDNWWLEGPNGSRPVLVVSRDRANEVMLRVTVAPITRRLRRVPSQLPLGRDEGLSSDSVANFDDLNTVSKAMLVRRMGSLGPRLHELCASLRVMADC